MGNGLRNKTSRLINIMLIIRKRQFLNTTVFFYYNTLAGVKWLLEKDEREGFFGSSKTSEAIKYCLKNWDKLIKFLNYSFVTPDTNAAERAIKPFVMARKNFLFSGSGKGAESSCFLYSLIETAKANDISLEDYLRCLFEKAPYADSKSDWEKLLPWNIVITPFELRGEWKLPIKLTLRNNTYIR